MQIATYGCSFTDYCLGTYSDILSCDHEVINRGRSGVGNDYILYTLMEDYKSNFLKNLDLVVVQWSGFTRWNYKSTSRWLGLDGSVYNRYNIESRTTYSAIKKFYNPVYEKEKFINSIIMTNSLLKDCGIPAVTLSYEKTDLDFVVIDNMFETHKGDYEFLPTKFSKENWVDDHPTLLGHLNVAKQIADISKNTEKLVKHLHNKIKTSKEFTDYKSYFADTDVAASS